MIRWLRMMMAWWFSVTTPACQMQGVSLAERERMRKLRLLSFILLLSFSMSLPLLIIYCLNPSMGTVLTGIYEVITLLSLRLTRGGFLKAATYVYLFAYIGVDIGGFVSLAPNTLLWTWLPITLPAIIAGLFLPFWTPFVFATLEGIAVTVFFLIKHQSNPGATLLPFSLVPSFLIYTNLIIYALAVIGAVYAFNLDKAVLLADRADELAEAHVKLQELATTDPITNLLNHRALTDRLLDELKHAQQFNWHLELIFIDIDHFKQVNDTWGHQAGDAVLAHAASLLRQHIPETAYVGRYGGEEFVIVYLYEDASQVESLGEELRFIVEQSPALLPNGHTIPVTISIGVAHFPAHGTDLEELLLAADTAMYCAKRAGRNRVCVASVSDAPDLVLMHR
ncbi:MAG: GGDEF domain-containing protein [Ktedonobacteraceae bacterium]